MNYLVNILLVTVLVGGSANALFVKAPEKITLLPQHANIVCRAVFYNPLTWSSELFPGQEVLNRYLQAVIKHRGDDFHKCYNLTDEQVATYVATSVEYKLLEKFQKDINECSVDTTPEYEFNCYVKVIEANLQDIYEFSLTTRKPLEWTEEWAEEEELPAIVDHKKTKCVSEELKELIESAQRILGYFPNAS